MIDVLRTSLIGLGSSTVRDEIKKMQQPVSGSAGNVFGVSFAKQILEEQENELQCLSS